MPSNDYTRASTSIKNSVSKPMLQIISTEAKRATLPSLLTPQNLSYQPLVFSETSKQVQFPFKE
jgi:hypothetical protein